MCDDSGPCSEEVADKKSREKKTSAELIWCFQSSYEAKAEQKKVCTIALVLPAVMAEI